MMHYQPGDYVRPSDLPSRVLCRVMQAEPLNVQNGSAQLLRLVPLGGPWPQGTLLIRLCGAVEPVQLTELWQTSLHQQWSVDHAHQHAA